MVFFKSIKKTRHYVENHESEVPWFKVVDIIFHSSKIARKKGNRIEIETERHYVLCDLQQNTLHVINAKRKR